MTPSTTKMLLFLAAANYKPGDIAQLAEDLRDVDEADLKKAFAALQKQVKDLERRPPPALLGLGRDEEAALNVAVKEAMRRFKAARLTAKHAADRLTTSLKARQPRRNKALPQYKTGLEKWLFAVGAEIGSEALKAGVDAVVEEESAARPASWR